MSNCSNHRKDLFGQPDMKAVAEAIGDLHYETLSKLLRELSQKLKQDSRKDFSNKRIQLSGRLKAAATYTKNAYMAIAEAWQISKPFMLNNEQNVQGSVAIGMSKEQNDDKIEKMIEMTQRLEDKYQEALKEIKRLKAAWIDVKERLPEDLEDVLMTHEYFGGIVIGYYCYDHDRWIDNSATDIREQIIITHWMSLPPTPEPKSNFCPDKFEGGEVKINEIP